jgi:hypothetical protein
MHGQGNSGDEELYYFHYGINPHQRYPFYDSNYN